ncbi:long-chain-fatty-acid-CoA ligase [Purpureocillium lavendulum]|uniref:Long-chain-fatty-acid-CoA ligase n=1 Tax=Purpureocillium lavendulum TaxID=1247861 RepID=A0AB34FXH3_9HYPO|nr:long-chain-fatty-acid-CoA ligase [Purpureocillium lavendulum]
MFRDLNIIKMHPSYVTALLLATAALGKHSIAPGQEIISTDCKHTSSNCDVSFLPSDTIQYLSDLAKKLPKDSVYPSGDHIICRQYMMGPNGYCLFFENLDDDITHTAEEVQRAAAPSLGTAFCGPGFTAYGGVTQTGPPEGMKYHAVARVLGSIKTQCSTDGTLTMPKSTRTKELTVVFSGDTNYDAKRGNAQNNFSFKGSDPEPRVRSVTTKAARSSYSQLLRQHTLDFRSLSGAFELALPDPLNSAKLETAAAITRYASTGASGDPFLEALLFDFSRYLLISSSRPNSLPANLQGRWVDKMNAEWGADYHANINLQMSYWIADQTGLASTSIALWNFMRDTWIPRGRETAKLLYNAPGWVSHHATNIFGHTGMKNTARWSNYPAAPAWMMQHVWDNFEYGQDTTWLRHTGYPFLKEVAQFWLSQLQQDDFNKDGSLVVNPCNSPEHGPSTFACTHFQQLIHQVFEAVLSSARYLGHTDRALENDVSSTLAKLDKGLHFTNWGGIKEWKLPDAAGYDDKNTHRHLSHLVGWYPGYSISSFQNGYRNTTIQKAIVASLEARGTGVDDQNTGWGKAWRAACWARLNETDKAHSELRLLISENFASNGFDMYSGHTPPFQIDANFGFGAAILSMLVVDLPLPHTAKCQARTIVLGPAIPSSWAGGSVKGLRLRGGNMVDFTWDSRGRVTKAKLHGKSSSVKLINVDGRALN